MNLMTLRRQLLLAVLALFIVGCMPLTFAHEGNIDFTRFTEVNVAEVTYASPDLGVVDPVSQPSLSARMAELLRDNSGFRSVTTTKTDRPQLVVSIYLEKEEFLDGRDNDLVEGRAQFKLLDSNGATIADGEVLQSGNDDNIRGLQDDLLDEVAYFFLRPYRI